MEIVTADGRVRTANEGSHADLFWAVRRGGGNFGIVTRFRYRLHPVGPAIVGGLMAWDAERSREILPAYRAITQDAPEELTLAMVVRLAPPAPFVPVAWHGKPVVAMVVCYTGDDARTALAPLRRLPDPILDTVGPMPYVALQSMLNANEPKGPHHYWKTESFPTSRTASWIGFARVRSAWEAVRGCSTGGNSVNFQLAEDGLDRLHDAYGRNFSRLTEVKATYDPDNLFRVNRNIPPKATPP